MADEKVSEKPSIETINPGKEQQKSIADMFKVDLCGPIKDQIGKEIDICGPNIEITPCSPLMESKWCLPTLMENCIPAHCIPTIPTYRSAAMRFTICDPIFCNPLVGPCPPTWCEPKCGPALPRLQREATICYPSCIPEFYEPLSECRPKFTIECIPDRICDPLKWWIEYPFAGPVPDPWIEIIKNIKSIKDEIENLKKRIENV